MDILAPDFGVEVYIGTRIFTKTKDKLMFN
jgi:hypothetical protein